MSAVGFVGLGEMGLPMASRLLGWPGGLVVCDVRPEPVRALAERGAAAATTPAEVARGAEVISVMVLDDDQVREVVLGPHGVAEGARPGAVVAIHSTIRAGTAEALAEALAPLGLALVDAPVTGGAAAARTGALAVMAGGPAEAVERCREPFSRFASLVVHVGPTGAGTRAKLARNLLAFVAFAAAGEAQRLAEAAGVDLGKLAAVVRHSDRVTGGPGAIMVRATTAPLHREDPWYPTLARVRSLGHKDLALALELGRELGVELPLAEVALRTLPAALGVPEEEV